MAHKCDLKSRLVIENGKIYAIARAYWKDKELDIYKECLEDKKVYIKQNVKYTNMAGWLVSFPNEKETGYRRYYHDIVPDYEYEEINYTYDGIRWARTETFQDVERQISLILENHSEYRYLLNKLYRNETYNMNAYFLFDAIHNWEEHPESEYLYQKGFFSLATNKSLYRLGKAKKKQYLKLIQIMPISESNSFWNLKDLRAFNNTGLSMEDYIQFREFTRGFYRAKDVSVEDWRYCVKKGIDINYYADLCRLIIDAGKDTTDPYWKYPSNPVEAHDRLQQMIDNQKAAQEAEKYEVLAKIGKRNLKEAVEIDGYQIFIPTNYSQFKACADLLNQCLLSADYVGKMSKGQSLIIMLWKNGQPSSTAEINYDKSIRQFYGNEFDRSKCRPSDEEYKVLDTFLAGFQPKRIRKYLGV